MSDNRSSLNEAIGIVVGSLAILFFAGFALVAVPYMQLDDAPIPESLEPHDDREQAGREHYVSLGCVYCHSQQPRDPSQAPDGARGWGRPSVPGDYAYETPHQLGTMRTGPDLFNIAARQPSQAWHLLHLYQPRAVVEESLMPAYPFLFELVEQAGPNDVVVTVPEGHAPAGKTVIAKSDALELVAYLLSLDHTYPVDFDRRPEPLEMARE